MMIRAKGFTLVELLLAVTLLSILLALAYGGLHASTRATDRGQQILEESGRLRMAHQFVRKQLNQAIPVAFAQQEGELLQGEEAEVFVGTDQSVRFVGPMPGYLGFGGPQVQQLSIVRGPNGMELVLEHALVQGFEESLLAERPPIMLIDRIESAEFQYQGRDEVGELLPWASHWEESWRMPVAISLDLVFEEGAYAQWPLLVAAVKIDGSVADAVDGGNQRGSLRTSLQQTREELVRRNQRNQRNQKNQKNQRNQRR